MQKLFVKEKTGFTTRLPFKIFDKNGLLFYSSDFTKHINEGKRLNFNLPKGDYFLNGSIVKLIKPVEFEPIVLPKYERIMKKQEYKIKFGDNPNKCTIFYDKQIILFDNSFRNVPIYMKFNIYFHEMGHRFFKTEKFADLFAAKKMLELGFNPSQIGFTNLETLSEKQIERKKFIVDNLTN